MTTTLDSSEPASNPSKNNTPLIAKLTSKETTNSATKEKNRADSPSEKEAKGDCATQQHIEERDHNSEKEQQKQRNRDQQDDDDEQDYDIEQQEREEKKGEKQEEEEKQEKESAEGVGEKKLHHDVQNNSPNKHVKMIDKPNTSTEKVLESRKEKVPKANGENHGHGYGHGHSDRHADSHSKHQKEISDEDLVYVGAKIPCKWRDDQWYECKVVEKRQIPGKEKWEFYVHYTLFNRRLDEWVLIDRLNIDPLRDERKKKVAKGIDPHKVVISTNKKEQKKRKMSELDKKDEKSMEEKEHEEATKVKNIQTIVLGKYEIDSWYYSPFPPEYLGYSKIFVCEFCLKFLRSNESLLRHMARCQIHHPPGIEIYRKDNISCFEVDGALNRYYCQNLCYISKLFLDHKTLYYDVHPFWFYIMCEIDERGCHIVGYFSKEKMSEEDYNVACILTFPPYQRKGYGKFLMSLSYELSKIEQKPGSPEKPLSDLGLLGYRSYWSQILIDLLKKEDSPISIQQIADITMMKTEDIISTLQVLGLIQYYEGVHIIDLRRVANMKMGSRGLYCDPTCIKWTPVNIPALQSKKK